MKCFKCGNEIGEDSIYCTKCGSHKPVEPENYCTDQDCVRCKEKYLFSKDDLYCDKCGKPTSFGAEVLKHL